MHPIPRAPQIQHFLWRYEHVAASARVLETLAGSVVQHDVNINSLARRCAATAASLAALPLLQLR
jgi:hypothetical protein